MISTTSQTQKSFKIGLTARHMVGLECHFYLLGEEIINVAHGGTIKTTKNSPISIYDAT
jgi:hypothetical protein